MAEIISVNRENIDQQHICCALGGKNDDLGVKMKKAWLNERFQEGLTFKKLDVRGKVFMEYMPCEFAWYPVEGENYLMINCFWVSGQYKGQGYGNQLLEQCIEEGKAQGKQGIVVISSAKKRSFLSDGQYLQHKGFKVCDTAPPYFELLALPFSQEGALPQFRAEAKVGCIAEQGLVLYHTAQCPHTAKYVALFAQIAEETGCPLIVKPLLTREQAQHAPTAFTTYSLFYQGKLVTHEILSESKIRKLLAQLG